MIPVHAVWVESHATALGAFDLNYCHEGLENWLELKSGPKIDVRASQVEWSKRRIEAGGHPLILVQWDDVFMIIPASRASALRENPTYETSMRLASTVWPSKPDAETFLQTIINPRKEYEHFANYAG